MHAAGRAPCLSSIVCGGLPRLLMPVLTRRACVPSPSCQAAYSDAPRGTWGTGLEGAQPRAADTTAGGPLFQVRACTSRTCAVQRAHHTRRRSTAVPPLCRIPKWVWLRFLMPGFGMHGCIAECSVCMTQHTFLHSPHPLPLSAAVTALPLARRGAARQPEGPGADLRVGIAAVSNLFD